MLDLCKSSTTPTSRNVRGLLVWLWPLQDIQKSSHLTWWESIESIYQNPQSIHGVLLDISHHGLHRRHGLQTIHGTQRRGSWGFKRWERARNLQNFYKIIHKCKDLALPLGLYRPARSDCLSFGCSFRTLDNPWVLFAAKILGHKWQELSTELTADLAQLIFVDCIRFHALEACFNDRDADVFSGSQLFCKPTIVSSKVVWSCTPVFLLTHWSKNHSEQTTETCVQRTRLRNKAQKVQGHKNGKETHKSAVSASPTTATYLASTGVDITPHKFAEKNVKSKRRMDPGSKSV